MSSSADALRLLFPLDLGGDHPADVVLEGQHLDALEASAANLLRNVFGDTADVLLSEWERVLGLVRLPGDTDNERRLRISRHLRRKGGVSIPYFTALALELGFVVRIEEPAPFMCGWSGAGEELWPADALWLWRVWMPEGIPAPVRFCPGVAGAGERLWDWEDLPVVETLFEDLKPADTFVDFAYT